MRESRRSHAVGKSLTCVLVFILIFGTTSFITTGEETREELILRVGQKDDTKTINYLWFAFLSHFESAGVILPLYGRVGILDTDTLEPIPYLLKGIDADGSGVFDLDEYGIFEKEDGTDPMDIVAYYDFNGVCFHDGIQATMHDLFFSYHVTALGWKDIYLDPIKDNGGQSGSNFSTTHWLHMETVTDIWDTGIPKGQDDNLTFAVRYSLQIQYSNFAKYTLASRVLLPRHIWEGRGRLCLQADDDICAQWREDIHEDFGYAYDEAIHNGIPASDSRAFDYNEARIWKPSVDEVVGIGPFRFVEWNQGVSAILDTFEDYMADALDCERIGNPPVCQGAFITYMHQPYIDGMLLKIYKTAQAAVFALQAGEIDVVPWPLPSHLVGDLIYDTNLGMVRIPSDRYFFLGYNMRMSPFGYPDNDPSQGDHGLYLRKAISHAIDKDTIVRLLLQNSGAAGDQPVHPARSLFYNDSVTRYEFNLSFASQILDDHYTFGGFALGYAPSGYRNLPTIGDREIEILCPTADYDPFRATACIMIAANMKEIGINATCSHKAISATYERLDNRDFDMWMGWTTGIAFYFDYVDIYYAYYYSVLAGSGGSNYPGFQNETFDKCATELRSEQNPARRAELVQWCSGILADALPVDVLYFRDTIEIYRSDRFVNWTAGPSGSIFTNSLSSWLGIHPPADAIPDLALSISAPSAIESGGTDIIRAIVRDLSGSPLPGLGIELCLFSSGNPGNLTMENVTGTCVSGLSNINGMVIAQYEAPAVEDPEIANVQVLASVTREDWEHDEESAFITIYPAEMQFLSVRIEPETGDVLPLGDRILLNVQVTDQDRVPVNGAIVNLSSSPEGLAFQPSSGITEGGVLSGISVDASVEIPSHIDFLTFDVIVGGELTGYEPGMTSIEVVVFELERPPPPPGSERGPDWLIGLILVLVCLIVFLVANRLMRRSRKGGGGKAEED